MFRVSNKAIVAAAFAAGVAAAATADTSAVGATHGSAVPRTHEIVMTNADQRVRFEPAELKIAVGDTVKWVQTGGSHNIVFWADSMPAGALPLLRAAMKDTVATLTTTRFRAVGDSYSIVFTGLPKGTYKYYCDPHLGRGMVGTIIIE